MIITPPANIVNISLKPNPSILCWQMTIAVPIFPHCDHSAGSDY